jgi:hypothetical protein
MGEVPLYRNASMSTWKTRIAKTKYTMKDIVLSRTGLAKVMVALIRFSQGPV